MNQKLVEELHETIKLITIEKKLGRKAITREEAAFIKNLAEKKHFPRAEYVLARMYLCGYQMEKDKALGMKYLSRSSSHASYELQLKIVYIYHVMGDFEKIITCLKRAIDDCKYLV